MPSKATGPVIMPHRAGLYACTECSCSRSSIFVSKSVTSPIGLLHLLLTGCGWAFLLPDPTRVGLYPWVWYKYSYLLTYLPHPLH